jgi:tetratricopeptide (TPR) repeat protein
MGFMLGDFADKLRPLGRLELLDSVSSKALDYLGAPRDEKLSMTALAQRAQALQVIAEVRRARGDSKGAAQALDAAQGILMEQHAKAPANVEVLKNLGVNAYWLGQIAKDRSDLEKAALHWKDYLKFSDDLNRLEPENVEWWTEQSYAHNNLGSLAAARGDPATAAREFEQSIALKRRALERQPSNRPLMKELADSYSWLGNAKEALGELAGASELYTQEMVIVQQLRAAAPGEPLWIRSEAWALQHRAANESALGQDVAALRDYRAAKELMVALTRTDENNLAWQAEAVGLEGEDHMIVARTTGGEKVVASLRDVHARLVKLAATDPKNVVWARAAGTTQAWLAELLLKAGQLEAARHEAQAAVTRIQQLLDNNKGNKLLRQVLVRALLVSADIDRTAGNRAEAHITCRGVLDMLRPDIRASRDYRLLDAWVRVNYCLGNEDAAGQAAARLRSFGYSNVSFMQFLSLQNKMKGKS